MIRLQVSGRSHGTGGRKTDSLTYPHRKKKTTWCYVRRSWWPAKHRLVFCYCRRLFHSTCSPDGIEETKSPRQTQTHLESFSFDMWLACSSTNILGEFLYVARMLKSLQPIIISILRHISGDYEHPCIIFASITHPKILACFMPSSLFFFLLLLFLLAAPSAHV